MIKQFTYSDVDKALPIDSSGNVKILYDNDVIIQSLKMLFAAMSGEYVRSVRGSDIIELLGRPFAQFSAVLLKQSIEKTIEKFEPRVTIRSITVIPNEDENYYEVQCDLSVITTKRGLQFTTRLRKLDF